MCTRPGHRPRLIHRTGLEHGPAKGRRKGYTENGHARLLDAAHQQHGAPIVLVRDERNTHISRTLRRPIDA
ncbi:transposase [Streptomyces sp. NPDC006259]|uniref:transposase n=1 Tax=Streptomyces sp. NPDC006259 TaxID=3364740 RepID=UPI003686F915